MSDFLSPEICKAARALLNWSQQELADHARIATRTLGRFENGDPVVSAAVQRKLRDTFIEAGLVFLAANRPDGKLDGLCVGYKAEEHGHGFKFL